MTTFKIKSFVAEEHNKAQSDILKAWEKVSCSNIKESNISLYNGYLGLSHLSRSEFEKAKESLEKACNNCANDGDEASKLRHVWMGHLGIIYSHKNESEKAEECFKEALDNAKTDTVEKLTWHGNLGNVYKDESIEKAKEYFSKPGSVSRRR